MATLHTSNSIKAIRTKLINEQKQLNMKKIRSNYAMLIGGSVLLVLVVIALLAPYLTSFDPYEMQVTQRLLPPDTVHLFGTDEFGRDLLTRVLYGARVSITVGLLVAVFSSVLGLIIGSYASYYPILDHLFMRICDGLIAIPGILLAIALMAALGASIWNVIIALTIVFTPNIARVVRSSAIVVKEQGYIEAVYVQGAGDFRILWLNIIPNVLSPLLIQASFVFASAILSEAALSFLGAGIPEPQASWGNILQSSKLVLHKAWWMVVYPGSFLVLSILSLNLLGDGLRDFFDPRKTSRIKKARTPSISTANKASTPSNIR